MTRYTLLFISKTNMSIHIGLNFRPPDEEGARGPRTPGPLAPPLFLKSYFSEKGFLEIRFCVILQGIQNFFGPGTPRILSEALNSLECKHEPSLLIGRKLELKIRLFFIFIIHTQVLIIKQSHITLLKFLC